MHTLNHLAWGEGDFLLGPTYAAWARNSPGIRVSVQTRTKEVLTSILGPLGGVLYYFCFAVTPSSSFLAPKDTLRSALIGYHPEEEAKLCCVTTRETSNEARRVVATARVGSFTLVLLSNVDLGPSYCQQTTPAVHKAGAVRYGMMSSVM